MFAIYVLYFWLENIYEIKLNVVVVNHIDWQRPKNLVLIFLKTYLSHCMCITQERYLTVFYNFDYNTY